MDTRLLARGLRARPTLWLVKSFQQPRALQPTLCKTLRYNSSNSSSQSPNPFTPPASAATQASAEGTPSNSSPMQQSTPEPQPKTAPAPAPSPAADFDDILNKLDLGSHTQPVSRWSNKMDKYRDNGRTHPDNISHVVGQGTGYRPKHDSGNVGNRKMELKLGPTLGRQVIVQPERGVDVAGAIRVLHSTLARNKIRQLSKEQKYHVRKGALRKHLKRLRWRRLFKFSFKETVKKIQKMQAQGW